MALRQYDQRISKYSHHNRGHPGDYICAEAYQQTQGRVRTCSSIKTNQDPYGCSDHQAKTHRH